MGYNTNFFGEFKINPPLKSEHLEYLLAFSRTRHIKRDPEKVAALSDPKRLAAGLPIGPDGAYFVGSEEDYVLTDDSIIDYNCPPGVSLSDFDKPFEERRDAEKRDSKEEAQPGLWCQWCPSDDGTALCWDEGEKFYNYIPWLRYLLRNFLEPWGYTLNGEVGWQGEDYDDRGMIAVENNNIKIRRARFEWDEYVEYEDYDE